VSQQDTNTAGRGYIIVPGFQSCLVLLETVTWRCALDWFRFLMGLFPLLFVGADLFIYLGRFSLSFILWIKIIYW